LVAEFRRYEEHLGYHALLGGISVQGHDQLNGPAIPRPLLRGAERYCTVATRPRFMVHQQMWRPRKMIDEKVEESIKKMIDEFFQGTNSAATIK
jgi:hypothetical protein